VHHNFTIFEETKQLQMKLKTVLLYSFLFLMGQQLFAQHIIKGVVYDKNSKETLIGANVIIPSTAIGTMTDFDGFFQLEVSNLPIDVEVSFIGFEKKVISVSSTEAIKIYLGEDNSILSEIVITDSRLTKKQKQSAITVEVLDILAIKETPAASFYEGLGALKGVDVTSASLGFKIINTRGFNSTSPVRSLQIIDGVDNQSPGLNFALGNFLGSSELDLKKVEIIVGANSALYGPNAFNGVISMETKDPFQFPGFSAQYKGGARNLGEISWRYAQVFKNKDGEDIFGAKFNFYRMVADDWVANNYEQAFDSPSLTTNPGGYDAVNRYGDEYYKTYSNFGSFPGLGTFHRTGYEEKDLVDYNTENVKMNMALYYKPTVKTELIYATNYGTGTTVYQGDNRYSLKGLQFFQNRLEFRQKDKFFIRLYETHEDAGNTYDAVATARSLQNRHLSDRDWSQAYGTYWTTDIYPKILGLPGWIDINDLQYYETDENGDYIYDDEGNLIYIENAYENWFSSMNGIIDLNQDSISAFHQQTESYVNNIVGQQNYSFLHPDSADFQQAFNDITSQTRYDKNGNLVGGTKFYDRSKLYHAQAEYKFEVGENRFTVGANARMYAPDSDGSIFEDGFIQHYNDRYLFDDTGNPILELDTSIVNIGTQWVPEFVEIIDTTHIFVIDTTIEDLVITNKEYGVYAGYQRDFFSETLKLSASARMDKNQNFDYLFSPAASIVYTPSEKDVLRLSLSSAIRNPTLTDQYLNYDIGPAILLGNINGFGYDEYFVNIDSLEQYFIGALVKPSALQGGFMQVDPIKPEKVKTIEVGYRTTLFNKLYVDASLYYSIYEDFIGYQTGASFRFGSTMEADSLDVANGWATDTGQVIDNYNDLLLPSIQGYRVAANAQDKVTTKGFTLGLNYFFNQYLTINGNYSWNKLNKKGADDPIIPAFNTPEHKFNLGFGVRDINLFGISRHWGFSTNYKWVQGFIFEGSPQFTGEVPSYDQLDAQINKTIPEIKATIKLGASNLLNNNSYQVYGGPRVGRMMYMSLLFDLN
jgi:iron complex outermembrane receptor protein